MQSRTLGTACLAIQKELSLSKLQTGPAVNLCCERLDAVCNALVFGVWKLLLKGLTAPTGPST